MRKLLFLTSVKGLWPFPEDISSNLIKYDYQIDFLDYEENLLINYNNGQIKRKIKIFKYRKIYRWKLYEIWKSIRDIKYRLFLKNFKNSYDVTLILYLDSKLNNYAKQIKNTSHHLVIYFAGSDFYAQNDLNKKRNHKLLDLADGINFTNPYMREDVLNFYGKYHEKATVYSIGIKNLDIIRKILCTESLNETKKCIDIQTDKIIITLGYSGDERHQHLKFLSILKNLDPEIKEKIFILVPMTYAAKEEYIDNIITILRTLDVSYKIITDILSDENISRLRIISDLFINIRTTDQLSGSMLEHLFSGSVVLTGDWLPYKKLDDLFVYYYKVNFDNIKDILCFVIDNLKQEKILCSVNNDIINNEFNWSIRMNDLLKIL
jgi:hypothetical protein